MSDLLARLQKASGGTTLAESTVFDDPDFIPTDIPIINIAFSGDLYGGLPPGLSVFAGDSKTYKTLLALHCIKAFLDAHDNNVVQFYDTERGAHKPAFENLGIDASRIDYTGVEEIAHIEDLKFKMVKSMEQMTKADKGRLMIVVDSIGQIASKKEVDDTADEKSVADMTRAKSLRSLLRTTLPYINRHDVPCIMINHTYDEIGTMYPRAVLGGGKAVMYSANMVFIISKAQEKEGTEVVGYRFTLNVEKSRFVKEKSKFPFSVHMTDGINPFSSLLEIALESGHVISPTKGWYAVPSAPDTKLRRSQLDAGFWDEIIDDPSFNEWIKKRYKYGTGDELVEESKPELSAGRLISEETGKEVNEPV